MKKHLWTLRLLFLVLCTLGGYAVSQVQPEMITEGRYGLIIGFGFGWLVIAVDEMVKGLSIRAFSAISVGLGLGLIIASLIGHSELFAKADEPTMWLVRVCLFLAFGYIGMILAVRSNKEDFSLIIPFVRFTSQNSPTAMFLLDTSVIIDGRISDLAQTHLLEGTLVVPRFVLKEIQKVADSADATKRARGRRGLDILARLQADRRFELKIHEADIPDETEVDAKLLRLAKHLGAKLVTNDHNLAKLAELQVTQCINLHEVAAALKPAVLPGDVFSLRIVREGKDKGQGVAFLNDGTMVVVTNGQAYVGQQVETHVTNVLQTGAGRMIFAEAKPGAVATAPVAA
ncbi:MAG: PIN domain nuclease [Verrucomicrobia bacterium]|nr:PIN domain nuclease [Verrucomicrobiota bacterium]